MNIKYPRLNYKVLVLPVYRQLLQFFGGKSSSIQVKNESRELLIHVVTREHTIGPCTLIVPLKGTVIHRPMIHHHPMIHSYNTTHEHPF